jgi:hypothetical protein
MRSVFINYRSVDHPLAAASIYHWLAGRFGEHRVFRDCVSLEAGAHYPTGIRSALENAAVLIAVIGPRWLTLTDPETGVRLIDRQEDWVRQEIATAFRRDIKVLPVLLKDTPENAHHPTVAELPDDIRGLATIQALSISQRTLGPDLDRLAAALARMYPAFASVTPLRVVTRDADEPLRIQRDFVETLARSPSLRDDSSREMIVANLGRQVGAELSLRRQTTARMNIMELVRVCAGLPGGLELLTDQLRFVDPLAPELPELRHLCEEWRIAHALGERWTDAEQAPDPIVASTMRTGRDLAKKAQRVNGTSPPAAIPKPGQT